MTFDASEVRSLAADLSRAPRGMQAEAAAVLARGAVEMKKAWQEDARGSRHFKQLARTITYDIDDDGVEVGPSASRRAAALAGIAHFGGVNGGGGTLADPSTYLDAEVPKIMDHIERLVGDVL